MVKHVVCFRLDDHSESAKLKAKEILLSMIGNVSLFTDITVGTDYVNSPRSYDVVLITTFLSREDLEAYRVDPYHKEVVQSYMHAHTISSVAVDFEI